MTGESSSEATPLDWLPAALRALEERHLLRRRSVRTGPQSPGHIVLDGRSLVNFGSNDYLGLAAGGLEDAVRAALDEAGWGSGASPLVSGRGALAARLETRLAEFEGTPSALLFGSGYAANIGIITSLVGRGDTVFSDAFNHASIVDGCRLSRARVEVYDHRRTDDLAQRLARSGSGRRLIVTDGLFSMDGDLAPLAELARLAREHGAMLVVDEAHATGVFGTEGRGVCEHLGVDAAVTARVGTLSKAIGSVGGFVAAGAELVDYIANTARTYIFSTAAPDACAAAALAALDVIESGPDRRRTLLRRAADLRSRLAGQGWDVGSSESQIIPVRIGDPERTMQLAARLRDAGVFVPGIRPPSVPEGQSLLRISLTSSHTEPMIERLAEALGTAAPQAL